MIVKGVSPFRLLVAHAKRISLDELPDVFINKIRNKRFYEFTTMDLLKYSSRTKDVVKEIMLLSDQVIED
jgi:hypothetical protein